MRVYKDGWRGEVSQGLADMNFRSRSIHAGVLAKMILHDTDELAKTDGFKHDAYAYIVHKIDRELASFKKQAMRQVVQMIGKREEELGLPHSDLYKKLRDRFHRMCGKSDRLSWSEWKKIYLNPIDQWLVRTVKEASGLGGGDK